MSTATQPDTTYLLYQDEQERGPYSLDQIRSMWEGGELKSSALYWTGGNADWLPLGEFANGWKTPATGAVPPRPPATSHRVLGSAGETTFFECENIRVTDARFIVGATTYALRNIASVACVRSSAARSRPAVAVAIGLFLIVLTFANMRPNSDADTLVLCALASLAGILLVVVGGIMLLLRRTSYSVVLASASGEVRALNHRDGMLIGRIVDALNQAIVSAR